MNLSNEQLQEKKAHLESELKKLQSDLVEILNQNDILTLENKTKDEIIISREKKLNEIKDKNTLDSEQLKTERICMIDRYDHEMDIIDDSIKKLQLSRDRYQQLEQENEVIQGSLINLRQKMSADSTQQAKEVHEINASTRVMREQMEAAFRKELIEMDLVFQRQAFSSMDDEKKKALLANSKLKDELALQSVGISNLSVRCQRDKQNQKYIQSEMRLLNQKIEVLRQKLSSLQMKKANTALDISALERELRVSQEQEKITLSDLKHWPNQEDLLEGIEEITDCYQETKQEMKLWHQRYKQLLQLFSDMKSITSSNTTLLRSMSSSIYVKQTSQSVVASPCPSLSRAPSPCPSPSPLSPPPLSPSASVSPSRSPSRPKYQSSQSFTENLVLQLKLNPELKTAFLPLVGRESTLLPPTSLVADCVRQVLSILQRGNIKKKAKRTNLNRDDENSVISEDESSLASSSLALSVTGELRKMKQKHNEHFQDPFTNHTKRLLSRIPNLQKSIYWNQRYLENLTPLKKNAIPFHANTNANGDDEDENECCSENENEVTEPTPIATVAAASAAASVSFLQQIEIPKLSTTVDSNENLEMSSNEFIQASWLKRYENILSDDLLLEDSNASNSKTTSPTSRMPSIFPPLSSLQSSKNYSYHENGNGLGSCRLRSQSSQQESFPGPASAQSSSIVGNGSCSGNFNRKQLPKDPLHAGKKFRSSSSQPLLLPMKKKSSNKHNVSLSKL